MSTRGLIGVRTNKKFVSARYNHHDSYYDGTGEIVVKSYFDGEDVMSLVNEEKEDYRDFLNDGLFCEYAYVYNKETNTLEIYRGFFESKQIFTDDEKERMAIEIVDELEEDKTREHYCHLVMIVDKKKHTQEQVLQAFKKLEEKEDNEEERKCYPEREIIPLEIPEGWKQIC